MHLSHGFRAGVEIRPSTVASGWLLGITPPRGESLPLEMTLSRDKFLSILPAMVRRIGIAFVLVASFGADAAPWYHLPSIPTGPLPIVSPGNDTAFQYALADYWNLLDLFPEVELYHAQLNASPDPVFTTAPEAPQSPPATSLVT